MKLVGPLQEPKFPSCMYHFGTPHLLKIPDFWSMPPQWRKIRRPLRTPLNQNFSIRKLPRWQSLNPPKKKKTTLLSRIIWPKKKKKNHSWTSCFSLFWKDFHIKFPDSKPICQAEKCRPAFFLATHSLRRPVNGGQRPRYHISCRETRDARVKGSCKTVRYWYNVCKTLLKLSLWVWILVIM